MTDIAGELPTDETGDDCQANENQQERAGGVAIDLLDFGGRLCRADGGDDFAGDAQRDGDEHDVFFLGIAETCIGARFAGQRGGDFRATGLVIQARGIVARILGDTAVRQDDGKASLCIVGDAADRVGGTRWIGRIPVCGGFRGGEIGGGLDFGPGRASQAVLEGSGGQPSEGD